MLHSPLRVRRRLIACLALTLGLSLAACGSSESDGSAAAAEGGFPTSVDAVYGKVTVDAKPERVVALSIQAADILVSLGVQPVAIATSDKELGETYPYLQDRFTGELDPALLQEYKANSEKIASYEPDLIVGSSFQITEGAYRQVSEVAPTHPGVRAGNVDWVDTTTALAALVGADARPILDEVEQTCSAARDKVPGLAGKTYQFVAAEEGNFRFGNGSVLECFGLTAAENQDDSMKKPGAGISTERLDELDADVLAIWDYLGDSAKAKKDPRWATLPAVTADSIVWADLVLASAANSPTPSSIDHLIDVVLPVLEKSSISK